MNTVARRNRLPVANLSKWVKLYKTHGGALGLIPGITSGRPSAIKTLHVTQAEIANIARMVKREGSITAAARAYAKRSRPALAAYLRHGSLSTMFRAAIRAAGARSLSQKTEHGR